ncbi:hypothetical protein Nepgr_032996 [Nepenthes gracilis]|uniref:Uncharacterized protein n=1 Tax=Nepenthes gracilis TaxID=150966 RepID=A0AAD3Y6J5_NEPGR|nr:hypothetical protein Nepgr_032996 [Nepenthes gracilis]
MTTEYGPQRLIPQSSDRNFFGYSALANLPKASFPEPTIWKVFCSWNCRVVLADQSEILLSYVVLAVKV